MRHRRAPSNRSRWRWRPATRRSASASTPSRRPSRATPMARRAMADPTTMAYAGSRQPLAGGPLDADDIAAAAAFLLSSDARIDHRPGPGRRRRLVGHRGAPGLSFVRTVLGDIDPAALGPTYAHEHIVIDPSPIVELSADFLLADVDRAVQELVAARMAGPGRRGRCHAGRRRTQRAQAGPGGAPQRRPRRRRDRQLTSLDTILPATRPSPTPSKRWRSAS